MLCQFAEIISNNMEASTAELHHVYRHTLLTTM